jgi:two-component system, sensor histidine kinase and response regulator
MHSFRKYVIYVQEERRAAGSKDEESERLLTEARLSAKNDLLATVSHEMRTPLNGIVGNADLLSLSVSDPWQIGVVRNISTCSKILLQIINDILDFAKVDSRKMELEMLPFSVSDCADAAIGVVSAALRGKKQNLIFHICPGSPREVIGDPTRTKQLVLNILNNASKFTPSGGTLELGLCVTENFINKRTCKKSAFYDDCTFDDLQGGSFRRIFTGPDNETKSHLFRFFVRDTGPGMSDQHLQSIFTPFTQVRSLGSSKGFGLHNPESGTGLGLSIVRKLLELMEGCCHVRTVEGKGSCFSVRVPVDLPDQKRSDDVDMVAGVSVAVVSRDKVHAEAIRSLLAHIGAKVQVSDRIEEVDGNPALCLLDVATDEDLAARMEQLAAIGDPNFDARLKALIQKAALIVPPWASANVQQRASEASSSHCLFAPLTVGALQELIKDAIRGSSSMDSSSTSLRESVGSDVPIKILVVEDNRPNRFVLVQLLERLGVAGENVVQAENGEEALKEMRTASFDLIFMDIHMPIMSGWEAASIIRSKPEDFQPFGLLIALTAASTLEEREESMKYMDMFISKPLQLTKLVDTLNQCCKRLKIRKVFEIPKEKARQRRPCKSAESSSCTNDRAGERPTSAWAAWIPGGGGSRERIGIFVAVALLILALIMPRLFRSECIPVSS